MVNKEIICYSNVFLPFIQQFMFKSKLFVMLYDIYGAVNVIEKKHIYIISIRGLTIVVLHSLFHSSQIEDAIIELQLN